MGKRVLVIGGPTGVGETTVDAKIIERYPIFKRLTTATTRAPRLKEKDKVDYFFFSEKEFKEEIKKGNILEHTHIEKRDVYYGSYKPDLEKKLSDGHKLIINPDLVGAKYYKENYDATTIFLLPDSMEDLERRHLKRDPNVDRDELRKRLEYAEYEIENEADFYDYKVYNRYGKLDQTIDEIAEILKKEGYKLK